MNQGVDRAEWQRVTDHEINLWCARFMGWREIRRDDFPDEEAWQVAVGEAIVGDREAFAEYRGAVHLLGPKATRDWLPLSDPQCTLRVMARAALQGIQISPVMRDVMVYDSFGRTDPGVWIDDPEHPGEAKLISAWCRLVCTRIMTRVKEYEACTG